MTTIKSFSIAYREFSPASVTSETMPLPRISGKLHEPRHNPRLHSSTSFRRPQFVKPPIVPEIPSISFILASGTYQLSNYQHGHRIQPKFTAFPTT